MTATLTPPNAPSSATNSVTRQHLWVLLPLAFLALFAAYPVARILASSTSPTPSGESAWASVLGSTEFHQGLRQTVLIAVGTTCGALLLGLGIALVLAFVPFPGASAIARLIDSVLALPSFLITLAFTFLYGTAGAVNAVATSVCGPDCGPGMLLLTPGGVMLAEITFFTPFVVRPALAAMTRMNIDQINVAASLGAGPVRVVRTVIVPEVWPALASGGSLVLLLSLNEFGIVLFTGAKGVTTLPVQIYTTAIVQGDLPSAAVIATVQVALSIGLYALYRMVLSRAGGTRRRGTGSRSEKSHAAVE